MKVVAKARNERRGLRRLKNVVFAVAVAVSIAVAVAVVFKRMTRR